MMYRRLPIFLPIFALLLTTLVPPTVADDSSRSAGLFDAAIAYGQARTVKIYGGTIGREPGYATGVIVSEDGQIITASGLILASRRIRVVLPNGDTHVAEIVRRSEELQTALLKIDADTPDHFTLAEPSAAQRGDWVLAISNVFKVAEGDEPLSVTLGVLSSRTRLPVEYGTQDVPYDSDMMLIDCVTANPGAPGGAVVDVDGLFVGMIGRIVENSYTQTRLNYAVPADMLARFVANEPLDPEAELVEGRAELGIRLFQLGGRGGPAYVDRVVRGSAAAEAGVRPDDLILSVDNQLIRRASEFETFAEQLRPGHEIVLAVKRGDEILEFHIMPDTVPE